jgi:hypothetical protein
MFQRLQAATLTDAACAEPRTDRPATISAPGAAVEHRPYYAGLTSRQRVTAEQWCRIYAVSDLTPLAVPAAVARPTTKPPYTLSNRLYWHGVSSGAPGARQQALQALGGVGWPEGVPLRARSAWSASWWFAGRFGSVFLHCRAFDSRGFPSVQLYPVLQLCRGLRVAVVHLPLVVAPAFDLVGMAAGGDCCGEAEGGFKLGC